MSDVRPDIDLTGLARKAAPTVVARPKRRKLRIVVPLVLIAGFAAVWFSTVGDFLKGAVDVTVVRPKAAEGAATLGGGSGALQRSGWVEPDPFAYHVTALAPGIVKSIAALEASTVHPGDIVATLVDDAAKLELAAADAALARASSEQKRAEVERDNSRASFDAALEITEAFAMATAEVDARGAEAEKRRAAVKQAQAQVRVAQEELAVQNFLAEHGGAGPRQVELAQAKADVEAAALAQFEAETALAQAELVKAQARLARVARERELRLADHLRVETAEAGLALAQSMVAEARAAQGRAQLTLERMTVRVPGAGDPSMPSNLVVSQRLVAPGSAVGGEGREPVCTLYDPEHLRVRVDVEQSEVRHLATGQRARIKAPTRPDALFDGEITRIVAQANIEKVTLQVHVKILAPDAALRPEMLVEVRFLGDAPAPDAAGAEREPTSLSNAAVWIPSRLLDGNSVWLIDAVSGRAARRSVEAGARDGERVLITRGLNVADKLIDGGRERVAEGARVNVTSEGGR